MAKSHKRDRIKACELAAEVVGSIEGDVTAAKLMALTVFFESYIVRGCDWTEKHMKFLDDGKVANLHVIAGGKL